jgi:hypothetical protein
MLAMDVKCDYKDALGAGLLDGLWFAAAMNASQQGDRQLQGELDELQGDIDELQAGQQQPGVPGADGADGADGQDGADGRDGADGQDGGNCWDDIGDFNEDGVLNSYDCLDYMQAGGDEIVVARGFIDSFGVIHRGTNILDASFVDVGEYDVVIDLSGSRTDLSDPTLKPIHFPVLLTVYATSSDPLPWSDNISALVAHYKFDEATSLDRTNRTLTTRVYILEAQTGEPVGANFSIMVLEP